MKEVDCGFVQRLGNETPGPFRLIAVEALATTTAPGQTTRDCPYLLRRAHLDATQSSSSPWVSKDRFLAGPNGRLHPRPTGYSDTAHRKVRNSVLLGPPTCTVDRTIFEMWLGGL